MTAYEYLNGLREALGVLPEEERANAIRYYEEYFLDAGPENEARVIEELGTPAEVAQQILNDYREIVRAAPRPDAEPAPGPLSGEGSPEAGPVFGEAEAASPRGFAGPPPHGRSPLVSLLAAFGALILGVVVGLPLLTGIAGVVLGLIASALVVLLGAAVTVLAVLVVLPLGLLLCGFLLCVFSLFLWGVPASALLTLGAGLCLLAVGGLLTVGCIRLCTVSFRPLLNAGGWCVEQCARFFRWCGSLVNRFLDTLKGV